MAYYLRAKTLRLKSRQANGLTLKCLPKKNDTKKSDCNSLIEKTKALRSSTTTNPSVELHEKSPLANNSTAKFTL